MSDWRLAVRSLARRPGFVAVAVLTFALGIGANTALFTVVDGVLLKPLPYRDPDRVVTVWQTNPGFRGSDRPIARWWDRLSVSYPEYEDWRDLNHSFDALGVYKGQPLTLTGGDRPEALWGEGVTTGVFEALGVAAALGRTFLPEEDHKGAPAVAVLSDGLWRRAFGADASVVGRAITLDDRPYSVVGVMPRGFFFPEPEVDLWVLLPDESRRDTRNERELECVARLKKGVTLDAAQADMDAVERAMGETNPDEKGYGVRIVPRLDQMVGSTRPALLLLFGAVGLVLLIACANVANLLLVRATGRRRELAVRAALGAGRARLVRELMIESLLLSAAGGVVGVGAALATLGSLKRLLPPNLPRLADITPDTRVLSFAVVATLVTGLAAAILPALGVARANLVDALQDGVRGGSGDPRRRRAQGVIVAGEIALAFVLLVGATLLVKSFVRLTSVPLGFEPSGVLALWVRTNDQGSADPAAVARFYDELTTRLRALPGVERVAVTSSLPLGGSSGSNVFIERPTGEDNVMAEWSYVSPDYFAALDISMLAGRAFTEGDDATAPSVVIVSRTMAERDWPGESPIGRRIRLGGGRPSPWATVVGVVADVHDHGFATVPQSKLYLPAAQRPGEPGGNIIIKAAGPPAGLVAAVQQTAWAVDPSLLAVNVQTLRARLSRSVSEPRFRTVLLSAMALIAAILAVVGVYGVMAFAVTERTLEIGIRMALGAEPQQVLRTVLGRGLALGAAGLAGGAIVAVFAVRLLRGFLFEVQATDPWTMAGVAAAVAIAALAASAVPAWRAAHVDPAATLRT